jgi:hypothetical protein
MADLPTARDTLPKASWLCLLVWCMARHHPYSRLYLFELD